MFLGSDRDTDHGWYCKLGEREIDDAILKFRRDCSLPIALSDEQLCRAELNELAEEAGFECDDFSAIVGKGLRAWRVSPSRSILNLNRHLEGGVPGSPMFKTLREQMQVLASTMESEVFRAWQLKSIPDRSDPLKRRQTVKFGGYTAITADDEGEALVNRLAHALHLWEQRNKAMVRTGRVKLPAKLYRGVRGSELGGDFSDMPKGLTIDQRACHVLSIRARNIVDTNFGDWSHSSILSFTSNESIAELFTKRNGVVIEYTPTADDVVASHATDTQLDVTDHLIKKHEREWIIRVPREYKLSPETVKAFDAEWLMAKKDVRAVALLDSHTMATYRMGDAEITARWFWNNNRTTGKAFFRIGDSMSSPRADFKKEFGFDPLPSKQDDVSDLKFFRTEPFSNKEPVEIQSWEADLFDDYQPPNNQIG